MAKRPSEGRPRPLTVRSFAREIESAFIPPPYSMLISRSGKRDQIDPVRLTNVVHASQQEVKMKNGYWSALFCMCAASLVLGAANASPLISEKEVKQVWEDRIATSVFSVPSGTHTYRSQQGHWVGWERLADAGYVALEKRQLGGIEKLAAEGMDSAITVKFTEKLLQETIPLSESPSLTQEGMARIRCMISFNRRLDRVIDISPGRQSGESIVLVAGTFPLGTSSSIYQVATGLAVGDSGGVIGTVTG